MSLHYRTSYKETKTDTTILCSVRAQPRQGKIKTEQALKGEKKKKSMPGKRLTGNHSSTCKASYPSTEIKDFDKGNFLRRTQNWSTRRASLCWRRR